VGCQDVEGRRLDALTNGPLDCAVEYIRAVAVHAEHEACVDHDAMVVQSANRLAVVAIEVLALALLAKIRLVQGLESYEEASETARCCHLQQTGLQDRVYCSCSLPDALHPAHAFEQ